MENEKKQLQTTIEIVCDFVFYQRITSFEESQSLNMVLFPFKNLAKQISFAIIDLRRSKPNQNSQLKSFNKEQFVSLCRNLLSSTFPAQILCYQFSKQSVCCLLADQNLPVRIVAYENIKSINQILREFVIVSLRLPTGFYKEQDCNYSLEGYKFNRLGKIRQNWSYMHNGRVSKSIFGLQNQKIRKQVGQNLLYSKNQLKTIIESIENINNLKQIANSRSKYYDQLKVLGQNFYHHEKTINNASIMLPILNYQIQLLCSIGRGQKSKSKIGNQPIKTAKPLIYNICLNLSEGIDACQNIITTKIQSLFSSQNNKSSQNLPLSELPDFHLTTMPTKLVNPHLFLKIQSKQKFSQYYVKGLYEYFHYGDQNFNDQGWGCAYRSLQTLLSWFRLQQKLNLITIPTVLEIQNLIDLIDCTSPQKLSNTNTWIGATEVSWVVKKLTGYDCRILHIKDGKDIVQHAEMFRQHLQNVGTPIMYGGDEYAYSIVGINYSWKLGEIMFCILDPHYNGNDKIEKIIEKKGLCWRKPEEMFKKGVFYNFCLPII